MSILRGRMHLAGGRLGDAAAESEAAIAAAAAVGADAYVSAACSLLGIITLRQGDLQAAASYVADCPVPLSSAAAVRRRLHGRARMVVDEDHGCLLGVTMIGPGVEELLHSATVAVAGQVPVSRLWHAVPAFPRQRGLAPTARGLPRLTGETGQCACDCPASGVRPPPDLPAGVSSTVRARVLVPTTVSWASDRTKAQLGAAVQAPAIHS